MTTTTTLVWCVCVGCVIVWVRAGGGVGIKRDRGRWLGNGGCDLILNERERGGERIGHVDLVEQLAYAYLFFSF